MTDEMGDTWRRAGTVDFSKKMITMTKHAKIRKEKREHFERYSFLFCFETDSADKETSAWQERGTDDDI